MAKLRQDIVRLSLNENTIINDISQKIEQRQTLTSAQKDEIYGTWEKGDYYSYLQDKITEYVNKSF